MTSGDNDADLLAQHVAGDPQAFATLYKRHWHHLVANARQAGSHEPEDAAQEALAKAAQKASQYPGPEVCTVSTWLQRICKNVVIDHWRLRQTRPTTPLLDDVPTPTPTYETTRRVRHALAALPPDQAHVLELHYLLGLSAVEISTRLKVNENTVKGRIRLGSAKMRVALTENALDTV
jgi:RNA polymerase sigma-70 factor (ECF subfamily)